MARKKKKIEKEVFVPSKYQQAIFDFVKNGQGNAVIEAVAGSGKTSTAIKCLEFIGKDEKILLTAFNTDIVEELKQKTKNLDNKENISCRTMHSLGYALLMSNYPNQIEPKPNEFKYSGYIYNNIASLSGDYYFALKTKDRAKYLENIKKLVNFGRYYLCENLNDLQFIEDHYHIPVFFNEKEIALKVMHWGKENFHTIDFTDMVWLPNVLNCKPYGQLYDWIICDECQDTMTAERMLILRCTKMSTRMLFFGEKVQCQPAGTKVLMTNGEEKDIKDVVVGDEVVSYNIKRATYGGFKTKTKANRYVVTGVEEHTDNRFVKVTLKNGMTSTYTPEHICLAKFNFSGHSNVWAVALMENEKGMFFIGKALIYSNKEHHGLLKTLRIEHCTKGWLLGVYNNKASAKVETMRLSQIYNIPLQPSKIFDKFEAKRIPKSLIDLYSEMGGDKIGTNALRCLEDYHLLLKYPISDAHNEILHARTRLHPIRACNLMPGIMECSYFDESRKSQKIPNSYKYVASMISKKEYMEEERKVYSLSVEGNHTYVADGIATHNCIYTFMGSDYRSFDELRRLPNTISLPLSISYRCAKNIVDFAKQFNKSMEPRENAEDGEVSYGAQIEDINDGDMVLCRVNAPLVQLYCKLTEANKPAYIRGKDIGTSLIRTITQTKEPLLSKNLASKGVFPALYNNLLDEIDIIMRKHNITLDMAMEDMEISQRLDIIEALSALSERIVKTDELVEKIKSLFSDKKMRGVSLSTIHKAKGLECENVFIYPAPNSNAKLEEWEKEQERNLEYVAYTRAKNKLKFLDEGVISARTSNQQQKVADMERIMYKVFALYGGNNRCQLETLSPMAAKHIIRRGEKIEKTRGNVIDLNKKREVGKKNPFIIKPKRRKK